MSPQPLPTLHSTSLHFFEEMFEPFIDHSRNITIRYQIQTGTDKNPETFTINVCSVNDSETPDVFHGKLKALTDMSVQQVDIFLQQQNPVHIDTLADYIVGKLDSMASIVGNHPMLLQDELSGDFFQYQVKSFSGARLLGSNIGDSQLLGPAIYCKTQKFAEVWLQVIKEVKYQVNLIRNMHKSTWVSCTTASAQDTAIGKKFKIKFNTTVEQEAYLFHFLVKSGIIDVPDRKNPQLFNWIISNFESKNRESIRLTSVQNKYYSHDLSTLDYWDQKFLAGLEFIHNERERLLKFTPK